MLRLPALFTLIIVLTACQSAYFKDGRPNENSTLFEVPVGSKVVLKQSLIVPAYHREIFLQNGKVFDFSTVNQWFPYCAFSLHAQTKKPIAIEPDTFVVRKVSQQLLFQLAGIPVQVADMNNSGGFDEWRVKAAVMELSSGRQPDVVKLTCAAWGLPQDISFVTVAGIRESLGNVVSLDLADSHSPVPITEDIRRSKYSGY